MRVDADASTGGVDASATYNVNDEFEVSVNITQAPNAYAGYQAKVQFDPTVLAYDDPPGVTYMGLGAMVIDTTPTVGADTVFAGSARISGTQNDTGQAHKIGFKCIAGGLSDLHLVTLVEDAAFGSKTMGPGGVPIDTALVDASVICAVG